MSAMNNGFDWSASALMGGRSWNLLIKVIIFSALVFGLGASLGFAAAVVVL